MKIGSSRILHKTALLTSLVIISEINPIRKKLGWPYLTIDKDGDLDITLDDPLEEKEESTKKPSTDNDSDSDSDSD